VSWSPIEGGKRKKESFRKKIRGKREEGAKGVGGRGSQMSWKELQKSKQPARSIGGGHFRNEREKPSARRAKMNCK